MENYYKDDVCLFFDAMSDVFGGEVSRNIASHLFYTLNVNEDEQVKDETKKIQEDIIKICLTRSH